MAVNPSTPTTTSTTAPGQMPWNTPRQDPLQEAYRKQLIVQMRNGSEPSLEMIRNAGLSDADYQAMYAAKKTPGFGSDVDLTAADIALIKAAKPAPSFPGATTPATPAAPGSPNNQATRDRVWQEFANGKSNFAGHDYNRGLEALRSVGVDDFYHYSPEDQRRISWLLTENENGAFKNPELTELMRQFSTRNKWAADVLKDPNRGERDLFEVLATVAPGDYAKYTDEDRQAIDAIFTKGMGDWFNRREQSKLPFQPQVNTPEPREYGTRKATTPLNRTSGLTPPGGATVDGGAGTLRSGGLGASPLSGGTATPGVSAAPKAATTPVRAAGVTAAYNPRTVYANKGGRMHGLYMADGGKVEEGFGAYLKALEDGLGTYSVKMADGGKAFKPGNQATREEMEAYARQIAGGKDPFGKVRSGANGYDPTGLPEYLRVQFEKQNVDDAGNGLMQPIGGAFTTKDGRRVMQVGNGAQSDKEVVDWNKVTYDEDLGLVTEPDNFYERPHSQGFFTAIKAIIGAAALAGITGYAQAIEAAVNGTLGPEMATTAQSVVGEAGSVQQAAQAATTVATPAGETWALTDLTSETIAQIAAETGTQVSADVAAEIAASLQNGGPGLLERFIADPMGTMSQLGGRAAEWAAANPEAAARIAASVAALASGGSDGSSGSGSPGSGTLPPGSSTNAAKPFDPSRWEGERGRYAGLEQRQIDEAMKAGSDSEQAEAGARARAVSQQGVSSALDALKRRNPTMGHGQQIEQERLTRLKGAALGDAGYNTAALKEKQYGDNFRALVARYGLDAANQSLGVDRTVADDSYRRTEADRRYDLDLFRTQNDLDQRDRDNSRQDARDRGSGIASGIRSFGDLWNLGKQIFNKGGRARAKGLDCADGARIEGKGTKTSDSIPAMLSDGEMVVNAEGTKIADEMMPGLLEKLNEEGLKVRQRQKRGRRDGLSGIVSLSGA